MTTQRINRWSTVTLLTLSLAAALLVVIGAGTTVLSGPPGPPHDENAAAHVFQLLIAALVPTGLLFLMTADWETPARPARPLAASAVLLALAFGVLYYFEKVLGY